MGKKSRRRQRGKKAIKGAGRSERWSFSDPYSTQRWDFELEFQICGGGAKGNL